MKSPIYPCLWFDKNASEAAHFYVSVFDYSTITDENPIVATFQSNGQKFMCLNGGHHFKMNSAISFFVLCETEAEIDNAWARLNENGTVLMPLEAYPWSKKYGWVQDKFGVNWQLSWDNVSDVGQKFTPSLMFTGKVHGKTEEAITYYTSIFQPSKIMGILKYKEGEHEMPNTVKHAQFQLDQNLFMAMDNGTAQEVTFNEAVSFVIECEDQQEIDYYWNRLTEGGEESQCGWLKDRYGISWQVVPKILGELMRNPEKSQQVVQAFMKMKKFDIDTLLKI